MLFIILSFLIGYLWNHFLLLTFYYLRFNNVGILVWFNFLLPLNTPLSILQASLDWIVSEVYFVGRFRDPCGLEMPMDVWDNVVHYTISKGTRVGFNSVGSANYLFVSSHIVVLVYSRPLVIFFVKLSFCYPHLLFLCSKLTTSSLFALSMVIDISVCALILSNNIVFLSYLYIQLI